MIIGSNLIILDTPFHLFMSFLAIPFWVLYRYFCWRSTEALGGYAILLLIRYFNVGSRLALRYGAYAINSSP